MGAASNGRWCSPPFVVRGREHVLMLERSLQTDELVTMDGESIARHVLTLSLLFTGRVTDELLEQLEEKGEEGKKTEATGAPRAISPPEQPRSLPSVSRLSNWPEDFSRSPRDESNIPSRFRSSRRDVRPGMPWNWMEQPRPRSVRFDDDVDIIAQTLTPPTDATAPPGAPKLGPVDSRQGGEGRMWTFPDSPQGEGDEGVDKARVRFFVYSSHQRGGDEYSSSLTSSPSAAEGRGGEVPHVIYSSTALMSYQAASLHPFAAWDSVPYLAKVETDMVPVADSEGDGGRGWIDAERKTVTAGVLIDDLEGACKTSGGGVGAARGEFLMVSQQWVMRRGREYDDGVGVAMGRHRHEMLEAGGMGMGGEAKPLQQQQQGATMNGKRRRQEE